MTAAPATERVQALDVLRGVAVGGKTQMIECIR